MRTVVLLLISNIFMTFAWYGHLKYRQSPIFLVILVSGGFGTFTASQLKVIQEIITLAVFVIFSLLYLKEAFRWNYAASFGCMVAAVCFAFRF